MFQCCLNGDGWQINTYCSGRGSKITESKWLSELELVNTPRPLQRYLTLEWLVIVLVWRQKPDVTGCLFSVRTVYPSVSCLLLSRQSTSEPQQFTAQLKSAYLHVFWPVNHQLVACFFILVITVIFLLQAEARASRDYLPSSHVMHHLRLLIIRTVSRSAQFVSSQHLVSLWALLLYVVYCFFASLCIHPGVFMWLIYSLIESRLLQARAEAFVMLIAGRWTAAVPFYQNTQPFFFVVEVTPEVLAASLPERK